MKPPAVQSLDHLVLTVTDLDTTCRFYTALGMEVTQFTPADGTTRSALSFGTQKINLHVAGAEFEPKARQATPGSGDLCFLSETPLAVWQEHLTTQGIAIEIGPIARTGATGRIVSLYVRDPDGNLIEIANRA
ncbi:VOC family protein [Tropicibacter naphthalenivorans]|uniref:Virulence protein n=1 Tax=Tropicibacter naphthalenivorans TaxID=441103 RepID=A0A0N7M027_9RHOB|nr:VOC family protein [Tropicibacter naphthalenivorans]CUH79297.1 Virulence protein [Tropicibacter naphthalenivorans]SMC71186.1 Catechol 2,3-dioxygenase [Tropicibacter naphthalenivorans]